MICVNPKRLSSRPFVDRPNYALAKIFFVALRVLKEVFSAALRVLRG